MAASALSMRILRMYVMDPRPSFSRRKDSVSGSRPATLSGSLMVALKKRLLRERIFDGVMDAVALCVRVSKAGHADNHGVGLLRIRGEWSRRERDWQGLVGRRGGAVGVGAGAAGGVVRG